MTISSMQHQYDKTVEEKDAILECYKTKEQEVSSTIGSLVRISPKLFQPWCGYRLSITVPSVPISIFYYDSLQFL